jgi:DNA polymerase III sliding clamp (beta) subunit (PCNA family)
MKLIAPAGDLRPFIEACADIAPKKNKRPVLEATLITADATGVTFNATNLHDTVWLRTEKIVPMKVGQVLLPSANLLRVIKEAGKEDISISWNGESLKATLAWGKSRIQLPVELPTSFPVIDRFDEKQGFIKLTASALTGHLKRTSFATQVAFTARALHGINVVVKGIAIAFAATDGMRFALVEAECENPDAIALDAIIPPVKLKQLRRLHEVGENKLDVQATSSWLRIRGPNGELAWRLIAGVFPKWEGYVPRKVPKEMSVNRKALHGVVSAHKVVKSSLSKDYRIDLTDGNFKLTARAGIDGDMESELGCPWTHGDFAISLDPEFLEQGLNVMALDEIVFGVGSVRDPVLMREHTPDFTYIYSVVPRVMS